jgi:hypothetical protein
MRPAEVCEWLSCDVWPRLIEVVRDRPVAEPRQRLLRRLELRGQLRDPLIVAGGLRLRRIELVLKRGGAGVDSFKIVAIHAGLVPSVVGSARIVNYQLR